MGVSVWACECVSVHARELGTWLNEHMQIESTNHDKE